MPSSSKAKGTKWESEVAGFLQSFGLPARRSDATEGAHDHGDILGLELFSLDCKDHKTHSLAAWADQAREEARNAAKPYGAVAIRRASAPPERAYVLLDLETFASLTNYIRLLKDRPL